MKALIDGDVLVYKIGYASDNPHYKFNGLSFKTKKLLEEYCEHEGLEVPVGLKKERDPSPVDFALHSMKTFIQKVLFAVGADEYIVFLTDDEDKTNFRHRVATKLEYKGNRTSDKPVHYQPIRDYLVSHWDARLVAGCEADDALGIEQMKSGAGESIICSIDKDMDMIPGMHYNWDKYKTYEVSPEDGLRNFYSQLLIGDRIDNISGVPGVGVRKAAKILEKAATEMEMFNCVKEAYEIAFFGEETLEETHARLLENGQLLWIWRKPGDIWEFPDA